MSKRLYLLSIAGFLICLFAAIWSKEPVKCLLSGVYIFLVGKYFGFSPIDRESSQYIKREESELNFLNMRKK